MKNFTEKIAITGGKYRGRKVTTPGGKTHPMGSRERLALFNMLGTACEGAVVLDAFAGSGALGCEALSRGADFVVFVDKTPEAMQTIKSNLAELGIVDGFKIVKGSFPQVFPQTDLEDFRGFDIILVDPPYDKFGELRLDFLSGLLKKDGVLVLSHPGEAPEIEGLKLNKTRAYAAAHISVYTKF
ncbi:RsmD family RNA methyltransferase [Candidatus Saccharibacteria bacterium]|nr:RsmD family RNA methyltransferase [Candidatus Saccharibacteria bacterium]